MGIIFSFLGGIPPKVWGAIAIILAILFGLFRVEQYGERRIGIKWAAADSARIAAEAAAKVKEGARQQVVVEKVVTKYVDRVKYITGQINVITKDIPLPKDGIMLGGAYRVQHDAAATGESPARPDEAVRAAAEVEAITYAGTVKENYGICRTNEAQLEALQEAVKGIFNIKIGVVP